MKIADTLTISSKEPQETHYIEYHNVTVEKTFAYTLKYINGIPDLRGMCAKGMKLSKIVYYPITKAFDIYSNGGWKIGTISIDLIENDISLEEESEFFKKQLEISSHLKEQVDPELLKRWGILFDELSTIKKE